jgi:hypothetical protein
VSSDTDDACVALLPSQRPAHYRRVAIGGCACSAEWTDPDGSKWCCQGSPGFSGVPLAFDGAGKIGAPNDEFTRHVATTEAPWPKFQLERDTPEELAKQACAERDAALRDHFAGQALLVSGVTGPEAAYDVADAMMAERAKRIAK